MCYGKIGKVDCFNHVSATAKKEECFFVSLIQLGFGEVAATFVKNAIPEEDVAILIADIEVLLCAPSSF